MKKAELEQHRDRYQTLLHQAHTARNARDLPESLAYAADACEFVDGMMQFERKYEETTFKSIEAIDLILHDAPLIFDAPSLSKVDDLLKTQKRIEKNTTADLRAKLEEAKHLLWQVYRLWMCLEQADSQPAEALRTKLGFSAMEWTEILSVWQEIGLVRITGTGAQQCLSFCTDMEAAALGKCPACGVVVKAAKTKLLPEVVCPKCNRRVSFVLIERADT